jgi:hypothetical protein
MFTSDDEYKGELTSKRLIAGPLTERRCTDILCIIVFFIFWFNLGLIGLHALVKGDPAAYTHPYDQFGK